MSSKEPMSNKEPREKKVQPRLLKGFRDYDPAQEMARAKMLATIAGVFNSFGFLPLQTPSLEFAETLLGPHYDEDNLKELFGFTGPDKVEMALRYEFTVSLARFVAGNPELPLPFKRYQFGNVWRVDKPGPGRYREFMQFDCDIVGSSSLLADAEIVACIVGVMSALKIDRYIIRYSSRKMLTGILEECGVPPEKMAGVLRAFDKLGKIGADNFARELRDGRTDDSGDKVAGVGLSASVADAVLKQATHLQQTASKGIEFGESDEWFKKSETGRAGVEEVMALKANLRDLGVLSEETSSHFKWDPTIVRGLGYYTGPVFETILTDLPEFGSVFSGGRYDNLVARFSNKPCPAVGASVGVDRLLAALIELKALPLEQSSAKALVTVMDKDRVAEYAKMANELRTAGIPTELFTGDSKKLTTQLRYADRRGIPVAVILGEDEIASGTVTVKNLAAGRERAVEALDRENWLEAESFQFVVERDALVGKVRELLESKKGA